MGKVIKDLLLALLNATLILVAVCLFLGWKLMSTVDGVVATAASNLELLRPLREEVGGMRDDVQGLRQDLAALVEGADGLSSAAAQRLSARAEALEARLDAVGTRLSDTLGSPEELIDHTIETAADRAARSIADLRGCTLPD
ncbi:hypothetical protein ACFORG_14270 [Lutimaribacter marinistellae]|uniref:Uncharacterized protein n=1 Tax=Lutimaribacter marinistellae TaxID=1820329 RepID=A0ABV7TH42_9RHOB